MTDPYACAYCAATFVVPSLARMHEATCPARPDQERQ